MYAHWASHSVAVCHAIKFRKQQKSHEAQPMEQMLSNMALGIGNCGINRPTNTNGKYHTQHLSKSSSKSNVQTHAQKKSKTKHKNKRNLLAAHICMCAQTCTRTQTPTDMFRKKIRYFCQTKSQRIKIDGKIYIRRNKSLKTIKTTLWWMWMPKKSVRSRTNTHTPSMPFHSVRSIREMWCCRTLCQEHKSMEIFFTRDLLCCFSLSPLQKFTFWLFSILFSCYSFRGACDSTLEKFMRTRTCAQNKPIYANDAILPLDSFQSSIKCEMLWVAIWFHINFVEQ